MGADTKSEKLFRRRTFLFRHLWSNLEFPRVSVKKTREGVSLASEAREATNIAQILSERKEDPKKRLGDTSVRPWGAVCPAALLPKTASDQRTPLPACYTLLQIRNNSCCGATLVDGFRYISVSTWYPHRPDTQSLCLRNTRGRIRAFKESPRWLHVADPVAQYRAHPNED